MKAQIFIVISILVLLALILLKVQTTTESKQAFYINLDIGKNADNIADEYKKTADISLSQSAAYQNLETNMNNISNFTYNSFNERSYSLKILYSTIFSGSNMTVTLGNFMGSAIYNITMNVSDGQNESMSQLSANMSVSRNFTMPASFNVTVHYTADGAEKNFTYASDSSTTVASYLKIYLSRDNSLIDNEFVFNKTAVYS